jgi:O-antigen biosynthesis protein WbqP
MKKIYIFFKYIADFILSLVGLIILSPIFIVISFLIKITSKGPVFFRQQRVGKDKKLFKIHKFRTMRIDTPKDCPTHLLENPDMYITKIGKFLRKTSLDELPQVIDILRGKMSIIGPRPALYNQDDLVTERDIYNANSLRPGLTGLAQVSGRDELEIPIKAALDGEYVKKISLWLDIKIFFKTVFSVLKSDGVKEGKLQQSITIASELAVTEDNIFLEQNKEDII